MNQKRKKMHCCILCLYAHFDWMNLGSIQPNFVAEKNLQRRDGEALPN
jgi:hypothetical protein